MSSAVSDQDPVAAVPEQVPNAGQPRLVARIRQMLVGVFLLDTGVLFVTSVLAWDWRGEVDKYFNTPPDPTIDWAPVLGPIWIAVWLVTLIVLGAYRVRHYGTGFEEFRAISVASLVTFAVACGAGFLAAHHPTRGYPILFFVVGTPLLLLARYIDRKTLPTSGQIMNELNGTDADEYDRARAERYARRERFY